MEGLPRGCGQISIVRICMQITSEIADRYRQGTTLSAGYPQTSETGSGAERPMEKSARGARGTTARAERAGTGTAPPPSPAMPQRANTPLILSLTPTELVGGFSVCRQRMVQAASATRRVCSAASATRRGCSAAAIVPNWKGTRPGVNRGPARRRAPRVGLGLAPSPASCSALDSDAAGTGRKGGGGEGGGEGGGGEGGGGEG